jgi:phospholipid/cholesterol/gamma-HCH transport system permease protein
MQFVKESLYILGKFLLFFFTTLVETFRPPFRLKAVLDHMVFIGYDSLGIIAITGFFTGAVFGLQIGGVFAFFKAEGFLGGATAIALSTELASLITAFLLAGKIGSAITAEISTMVINEQVQAIETMGINPINFLVKPRFIASIIMMPLLCGFFMFIGMVGAYLVGVFVYDIEQGIFMDKLVYIVDKKNLMTGYRKIQIFSMIIATVSCFFGLNASGGAKGVGRATTNSVVCSIVLVLLMDLIVSYFELRWLI